jgi:hypothetical protein
MKHVAKFESFLIESKRLNELGTYHNGSARTLSTPHTYYEEKSKPDVITSFAAVERELEDYYKKQKSVLDYAKKATEVLPKIFEKAVPNVFDTKNWGVKWDGVGATIYCNFAKSKESQELFSDGDKMEETFIELSSNPEFQKYVWNTRENGGGKVVSGDNWQVEFIINIDALK